MGEAKGREKGGAFGAPTESRNPFSGMGEKRVKPKQRPALYKCERRLVPQGLLTVPK